MEYHIISKKQLIHIFVFSCIALIITFIYQKTSLDQVYVCQGRTQITFIIQKDNRFYLSPSGSSREVLDCLGKSLPIYVRSFRFLAGSAISDLLKNDLSDRYNIDSDDHDGKNFEYVYLIVDDYTFVGNDDILIGIKRNAVEDPFELEKIVELHQPKQIIVPKITDHIFLLIQKSQILRTVELMQMDEGDFYKRPLL
ncbi:hypothetical protein COY14_01720 [Candidatus Roizmanbacteria bacterium CG_4_10_14_0_2_um_filter_36_9]|uniref:Uncharacterized protein n=1 Tax=Candidatus Roizmanbacteria bacterium CG_4_10_14_0_2_um_filter_36_9 TaxID=1974823 RepID=A0A2M7U4R8_9BACT|nr:MAG: hypothetical protein COY14_01720 [Candidatus Roizmanbacteria bacterium CG_4_10_14_0_2_um_filter_36_9]